MKIHFLGANRQVTGSRYLLESGDSHIVIDCGMFQERPFLERNWNAPSEGPDKVDAVILTHAHLDHVGLLPRMVKAGVNAPVYCTEPTVDLASIVMLDAGRLQEEDAEFKRKRHRKEGRSGPHPVVPLYTAEDAEKAKRLFRGVPYDKPIKITDTVEAVFHEAGHILGSATVELIVHEAGRATHVVFSGDIGQDNRPLVRDPRPVTHADYLILESTYGDRNHKDAGDVGTQLADVVNQTVRQGGKVVIPTFAVERAQELMYHFAELVHARRIDDVPVFLDSPMAVDVTKLFEKYEGYLDIQTREKLRTGKAPMRFPGLKLVREVQGSMAINNMTGPAVIMSTSGMCTGGRIKHHLKYNISGPTNTILFVGFQASGTLGRHVLNGMEEVRIHGQMFPVRARIAQIHGFSGHADRDGLLEWTDSLRQPPRATFLTHGEVSASESLAVALRDRGWNTSVPEYGEIVELS